MSRIQFLCLSCAAAALLFLVWRFVVDDAVEVGAASPPVVVASTSSDVSDAIRDNIAKWNVPIRVEYIQDSGSTAGRPADQEGGARKRVRTINARPLTDAEKMEVVRDCEAILLQNTVNVQRPSSGSDIKQAMRLARMAETVEVMRAVLPSMGGAFVTDRVQVDLKNDAKTYYWNRLLTGRDRVTKVVYVPIDLGKFPQAGQAIAYRHDLVLVRDTQQASDWEATSPDHREALIAQAQAALQQVEALDAECRNLRLARESAQITPAQAHRLAEIESTIDALKVSISKVPSRVDLKTGKWRHLKFE